MRNGECEFKIVDINHRFVEARREINYNLMICVKV